MIFLSEAFTRPRVMEQLAKIGFSQSYTYFTWRTSKWEARELPQRTCPFRRRRLLPTQPVAQHARHLER